MSQTEFEEERREKHRYWRRKQIFQNGDTYESKNQNSRWVAEPKELNYELVWKDRGHTRGHDANVGVLNSRRLLPMPIKTGRNLLSNTESPIDDSRIWSETRSVVKRRATFCVLEQYFK